MGQKDEKWQVEDLTFRFQEVYHPESTYRKRPNSSAFTDWPVTGPGRAGTRPVRPQPSPVLEWVPLDHGYRRKLAWDDAFRARYLASMSSHLGRAEVGTGAKPRQAAHSCDGSPLSSSASSQTP